MVMTVTHKYFNVTHNVSEMEFKTNLSNPLVTQQLYCCFPFPVPVAIPIPVPVQVPNPSCSCFSSSNSNFSFNYNSMVMAKDILEDICQTFKLSVFQYRWLKK